MKDYNKILKGKGDKEKLGRYKDRDNEIYCNKFNWSLLSIKVYLNYCILIFCVDFMKFIRWYYFFYVEEGI